jgi:hypothetical protein
MTSAIADAREAIAQAILARPDLLPAWRVHRYPPATIAAPCVWIDSPALARDVLYVAASFPVVLVVDGTDQAQLRQLDDVMAVLWDATNQVDGMEATDATPVLRDVGGPTLRAVQLTVTHALGLAALCPEVTALSEATPAP